MGNPPLPGQATSDLLQRQYQASGTIYGSNDPVEILEAVSSFLDAGFVRAELALVSPTDPSVMIVQAVVENGSTRRVQYERPVSDYPASDAVAAVEILNVPDVARDYFLEDEEKNRLAGQGVAALVMAPMVTAQNLIGLLLFTHNTPLEVPAPRLRALRSLVDQAAVVFENQRLLMQARASADSLAHQVQTLATINQIATGIARYTDQQELLNYAAYAIVRALDVDHVGVILLEEDRRAGIVVAEYPLTAALNTRMNMVDNPLMTLVLRDPTKPLIVEDAQNDPSLPQDNRDLFKTIGIYALCIVPLVIGGEVIGSIGLDITEPNKRFNEQTTELVGIIGSQLTVALQNARLITDAQRRADEQQRIARDESLVSSLAAQYQRTSNIEDLLTITVRELGTTLGARRGRIRLEVPQTSRAGERDTIR
jgi:GAF domain-containing protein